MWYGAGRKGKTRAMADGEEEKIRQQQRLRMRERERSEGEEGRAQEGSQCIELRDTVKKREGKWNKRYWG